MRITEFRKQMEYDQPRIFYFQFEQDFVEHEVRCIPMIVRFKLDRVGIKLKLSQWSNFAVAERVRLALLPCETDEEVRNYERYLADLIGDRCNEEPVYMDIELFPAWMETHYVPPVLQNRLEASGLELSVDKWSVLPEMQRFALVKLSESVHEHKNFLKAMQEFALLAN